MTNFGYQTVNSVLLSLSLIISWSGAARSTLLIIILGFTYHENWILKPTTIFSQTFKLFKYFDAETYMWGACWGPVWSGSDWCGRRDVPPVSAPQGTPGSGCGCRWFGSPCDGHPLVSDLVQRWGGRTRAVCSRWSKGRPRAGTRGNSRAVPTIHGAEKQDQYSPKFHRVIKSHNTK